MNDDINLKATTTDVKIDADSIKRTIARMQALDDQFNKTFQLWVTESMYEALGRPDKVQGVPVKAVSFLPEDTKAILIGA